MALTGTQSVLQFFGWALFGALIGSFFYALVWLVAQSNPAWSVGLGVLGAILIAPLYSGLVVGSLFFCLPGAYAEKVLSVSGGRGFVHYFNLLSATMLSVLAGIFLLGCVPQTLIYPWCKVGLGIGLVCTPSSVPLLRWLWRKSQTLPGVERELDITSELT